MALQSDQLDDPLEKVLQEDERDSIEVEERCVEKEGVGNAKQLLCHVWYFLLEKAAV